jgi:hypothetical protein
VDRSLRRLGQLLVTMGALLGAITGVTLALLVEHAEPSRAVAEPEHERPAVLAASPPSRQPPASQTARSEDLGDGSDSSAQQRAASAGRAAQRDGKADKNGESRKNKAGGSGKDKAGKGNDK